MNSVMKYILMNIIIKLDILYIISSSKYLFDFSFFDVIMPVSNGKSVNSVNHIIVFFIFSLNVYINALVLYVLLDA